MSKEECLKLLNETEIELKKVIENSKQIGSINLINEEEELYKEKNRCEKLSFYSLLLIIVIYKTELSEMFLNLLLVIFASGILGYLDFDEYNEKIFDISNNTKKICNKCELEIKKIEKFIEFLNQMDDDELNKYLSYKIN